MQHLNPHDAASMARDIEQKAPHLEAKEIVGDMLDKAQSRGLDLPLVRAAYCHLQVYEIRQTPGGQEHDGLNKMILPRLGAKPHFSPAHPPISGGRSGFPAA